MDTLTRGAGPSGSVPGHARGRLNWAGRLLTTLVFVAGLLFCVWAGWLAGTIYGLKQAEPIVNAPAPPGVGLAPNLGPMVDAAVELGTGLLIGIGVGLVVGVIIMLLVCRFVVIPLVRRIPRLTQRYT